MELGIVTIILSILSWLYLKIADRYNIIDKPNQRSSHTEPTIRGGGILFVFALWIFFCKDFSYVYVLIGATSIAIISFIDDIKTLSSAARLPFQFIAMALVLWQLQFDAWLWFVPLMILMVGFMNLYNFMDGINGITVSNTAAILLSVLMINQQEQLIETNLILYLLISCVVFGYYNFRKKARFFAGDIGSISIAVILSFFIVAYSLKFSSPLFILWFAVYGVDSCLTIMYRKSIGEKIMQPHRKHIYQKLVDVYKTPHLLVASIYGLLQLLIGVVVFYTYEKPLRTQILVLLIVLAVLTGAYIVIFKKIEKKVANKNHESI